ncbi:hypothetical protein WICPIJ_006217 [Wickerhamomyces pijperi]|uniref:Uncharacterized protein n=1 Tax=Wickerhamomyces pijperi TaxID=599730 RepID=A0A9P8Q2H3_WICPI|nr:hypothetical protein WICPIJ_006217 [Wickerhamomyces pijperi]
MVVVKTTKRIPPPGPNLSTLGKNPLLEHGVLNSGLDDIEWGVQDGTESGLVDLGELVIGSELGGSLWSFHQDWSSDTLVQSGWAFVFDNLGETVHNTAVLGLSTGTNLQLNTGLDDVQWVHHKNFRDTGNGTG